MPLPSYNLFNFVFGVCFMFGMYGSYCNATYIVSFTQNGTCFEGAQTDSTVHIIKNADAK